MRKKSKTTAIAVILMLIPLVFIAVLLVDYFKQSIALDGTDSVNIVLTDGKSYTYTEQADINYYCSLFTDAKEIDSPVRDVYSETPITITYIAGSQKQVFKLYPSLNLSGCMFYNEKGRIYLMNEIAAKDYLCRAECLYLYKDIMLPALEVVSGGSVEYAYPDSYSWSYKKADGSYYADRTSPTYDGKTLHFYDGRANSLNFSLQPDEIYDVEFVTADGAILPVSGIETLVFDDDTVITASFKAKWTRSESHDYYGEAEYCLTMLYDIPATASLLRESVAAGGFAVIDIEHLGDDDVVSFGTDIKTSSVIPYHDDASSRDFAILPVSADCEPGLYDINFELDGRVQTLKLLVNEAEGATLPLLESETEFSSMLTPEILQGLGETFSQVTSERAAEAYFDMGDKFQTAVTASKVASFADTVLISGSGAMHKLPGNVYSVSYGTAVKAMQRGKVVFAQATATTGNTVIISHGYGIYSYYFNLSSITCNVDDIMTQGQTIGLSGNSGYTWDLGDILHTAISVCGTFVDQSLFIGGNYFNR